MVILSFRMKVAKGEVT